MRGLQYIILVLFCSAAVLPGCKKYVDPAATNDPRLVNPYCNDPEGINYNWGFPGVPDNSTCIYASDEFRGSYILMDSVVVESSGLLMGFDSGLIYINSYGGSKRKLEVNGLCKGGGSVIFTSARTLVASVDTTVGDSLTFNKGQIFCRLQDTVTGTISRDPIDKALVHVALRVKNDTGVLLIVGDARKQ